MTRSWKMWGPACLRWCQKHHLLSRQHTHPQLSHTRSKRLPSDDCSCSPTARYQFPFNSDVSIPMTIKRGHCIPCLTLRVCVTTSLVIILRHPGNLDGHESMPRYIMRERKNATRWGKRQALTIPKQTQHTTTSKKRKECHASLRSVRWQADG